MTILSELSTKQISEPIKQLYMGFEERGCKISASMLRTAFIQKKVLEEPEFVLTEELRYFIEKEALALETALTFKGKSNENSTKDKSSKGNKEFSQTTPFLLAKLSKFNFLGEYFEVISRYAMIENKLFNVNQFDALAKNAFLKLYNGHVDSESYAQLLNYSSEAFPLVKEMQVAIKINHMGSFEELIRKKYEEKIKSNCFESPCEINLKETLIVMAIYFWNAGDLATAQLYLTQTLLIMNESEHLYNTLLFLRKELNSIAQ